MPSFFEIGPPVLEKIFEGFLLYIVNMYIYGRSGPYIYGRSGHLGHVTWISYIHIGSPFL